MAKIESRYPSPDTRNPYQLNVGRLEVPLDVLSFEGYESLGKPFRYTIRFACALPDRSKPVPMTQDDLKNRHLKPKPLDLDKAFFLNRFARFGIYGEPPVTYAWEEKKKKHEPLRELFGVVTSFKRTGASLEQGQYEITLEPRLARLARGKQYRLYRFKSVPQIVQHILMERHGFKEYECRFETKREYPVREHVIQYDETDLAFIERLLAEVGIWYRFFFDSHIGLEFLRFHDTSGHDFPIELPFRTPAGMSHSNQDAVWDLVTHHQVVERDLCFRTYDPRQANKYLTDTTELHRLDHTVYGKHYAYGWSYTEIGERFTHSPTVESGHFFAYLTNERNMNLRSQVSGVSSSPLLMPVSMLTVVDAPAQDFSEKVLVHTTRVSGGRKESYRVEFEGMSYDNLVYFRPALLPKPVISGTLPARVTQQVKGDPYSHIDHEGRYRVRFLFDLDERNPGQESLALRLARPYAGHRYGSHFPLIAGTEVAVAFERGDPDRPYISHALHDSEHPDHVAFDNHTRNVLRTPRNNKLRMEDRKGEEHVKLSTDFGGKSQLNLGHLVDKDRDKRGEGFELRTDAWGALRAGKGLLISTDERTKADGTQLDMDDAIAQLTSALALARSLSKVMGRATMTQADTECLGLLNQALAGLSKPGILVNAPNGIGVLSPEGVCVASAGESVSVIGADNVDIAAGENFTAAAGQAVSLMAKAEMQVKAVHGKVELHAQNNRLHALAKTDIKIESVSGRVEISAPQELVLNCGGAFIRLKDGNIELGAPGNIFLKAAHVQKQGKATLETPAAVVPSGYSGVFTMRNEEGVPERFSRYRITTQEGEVFEGITDKEGKTVSVNTSLPGELEFESVESEQWITFSPRSADYRGFACFLKMEDGKVLDGKFDDENKAGFYLKDETEVKEFVVIKPDGQEVKLSLVDMLLNAAGE